MSRFNRVLMSQYQEARKLAPENIKFMMSSVVGVWYVRLSNISGLDHEYAGGEYVLRMTIPETYPLNSPKIEFMTENGVYRVHVPICMDAHRTDMIGFANIIISQMINWRDVTPIDGTLLTTCDQKVNLAMSSQLANTNIIVDGVPLMFT